MNSIVVGPPQSNQDKNAKAAKRCESIHAPVRTG
jgi:hypothetical protein